MDPWRVHGEVLVIQASTGYPNEANGGNRVRLYQHGVHVGSRVAHGLVLVVYVAGLVGLAFSFPSRLEWRDALALMVLLIFPWFAGFVFRTRRVYGSARGLEYNRGREWRTVPWSDVEPPEYTWWSVGRPGRIAALRIRGEEK